MIAANTLITLRTDDDRHITHVDGLPEDLIGTDLLDITKNRGQVELWFATFHAFQDDTLEEVTIPLVSGREYSFRVRYLGDEKGWLLKGFACMPDDAVWIYCVVTAEGRRVASYLTSREAEAFAETHQADEEVEIVPRLYHELA